MLKVGNRTVALAVGSVIGMREVDGTGLAQMPPLLSEAHAEVVEAIGVLDARLLLVLRASRLLPQEAWEKLAARASPS